MLILLSKASEYSEAFFMFITFVKNNRNLTACLKMRSLSHL
ncbi:hypothetical protein appser13_17110 [Actinobacillus pleuropneumoniae serovar 13 str. N273]|nr:hypothetical protein appser4_16870 [Actinobacillus pleuropneumoniae serovar 4 str. M62]EFN02136.1 hypothetical protein appser13_17110 [Actinobacillus pleuropneumoniae serovar 13 str. N273]